MYKWFLVIQNLWCVLKNKIFLRMVDALWKKLGNVKVQKKK